MSKKKRKSKKAKKQGYKKTEDSAAAVAVDVRPDLRKTAILTAVCLGILLILYLTQSRWSELSLRS